MVDADMQRSHNDKWARGFWLNSFMTRMKEKPSDFQPDQFIPKNSNGEETHSSTLSWNLKAEADNEGGGSVGGSVGHSETVSFKVSDWSVQTGVGEFLWYQSAPFKTRLRDSSHSMLNRVMIHDWLDETWGLRSGSIPSLSYGVNQYEAIYSYRAPRSKKWKIMTVSQELQLYAIGSTFSWGQNKGKSWRISNDYWQKFSVKTDK